MPTFTERIAHVCCYQRPVPHEASTIVVPSCIKEDAEQLFEIHKRMDDYELRHTLVGLDVGNV